MPSRLVSFTGWFLVCLTFVGCSPQASGPDASRSSNTNSAEDSSDKKLVDEVELALNWLPEAEHGGFFAADVHGLFAERNLRVKIVPGGPGVPVVQNVASGKMTFGVTNADQVLLNRAQEADVVAIFAPLQQSPRCLMLHRKSGITQFDDLKDITLAINANQTFLGFVKKRLPLINVRIIPYGGSVAPFLADERMGQQAYVFSEPFIAKEQGADTVNLMVADIGFNPYTSVLITRGEVISQQPRLVRRMVEACILGWRQYLDDPATTNARIHELNPEMGIDILRFGAETIKPLSETGLDSPEQLGRMTAERWQTLADQLVEGDALKPGGVDASKAFDSQFLSR